MRCAGDHSSDNFKPDDRICQHVPHSLGSMSRTNYVLGLCLILLIDRSMLLPEGPSSPASVKILEQIKAHQKGIALWWTGNAGWLIKSDGLLIGIDLDLQTEEKVSEPPV